MWIKIHILSHCIKTKKYKDNDEKSKRSTSSRASVKKLGKAVKKISRVFTTVNTLIQNLK